MTQSASMSLDAWFSHRTFPGEGRDLGSMCPPTEGRIMAIQTRREVECFPDRGEMLRVEAERVVARAIDAVARRARFLFCLAGGATPKPLYELLASAPIA